MTIAIGFYLPISTTSIILIGALVRVFIEKSSKSEQVKEVRVSNGISLSSGLVAGGSIIGLVGFVGSNLMAYIILIVLVLFTILPLLGSKVHNSHENDNS